MLHCRRTPTVTAGSQRNTVSQLSWKLDQIIGSLPRDSEQKLCMAV